MQLPNFTIYSPSPYSPQAPAPRKKTINRIFELNYVDTGQRCEFYF